MIGKQILNYRIESLIGQGGMGSVYLASNINIDHKVAIKILKPGLANNPEIRKRFEREAATLASFDHPNIVKFLNYYENEESVFLIMEYVRGRTLESFIKEESGPIPEGKTLDLFSPILDAFSYAHEMGIVHRDIKPSNILITADNKVKILDFGIARIINEAVPGMTQAGTKMGTAMYMSPEQVRGKEVDKRSDIYSLGVVLYQMITGQAPYDDTTMSEFDLNVKVVEEKLPRAKEFYPFVSDKVQAIIDKAVEKNPENRYNDCNDFKYHLTKAIRPEEAVKPKSNPMIKWIAAAAGVLLIVAAVWFWDYNRVKVKYYKDFVEQWGVPQGIHKLSSDEVEHRDASYRFEYRKGKLQRFSRVNSADKIREAHDSEHTEDPNDMKLFYNSDGKLDYSQYLDRNGKILYLKDYNQNFTVVIFKHADALETEFVLSGRTLQMFSNPFSNASDERGQISRYLITYDDKGFIKKIQYAKYQNILVGDKDGIFGREFIRDDKGRVVEEHYLGYDGKPKATKKGLGIKKHVFIDNDDWVETRYMDIDGQLAMDESGVPIVKLYYDNYGNRIKEEYVNKDGKPVNRKDTKAAGFLYKYDEKGNCIDFSYMGVDGKVCTGVEGIACYRKVYDEFGNVIKTDYLNTESKPTYNNEGYSGMQFVCDAKGNVIELWYLDDKGTVCLSKDGYAGYKRKFDSIGNETELVFYGLNKKPCLKSSGIAGYRLTYNELNKISKWISLDTNLQPAYDKNNISIAFRRYDKRGNQTGSSFYDISGLKLKNSNSKNAGWNSVFDDQGNETSTTYFDADSSVCLIDDGFASTKRKYDERGNNIETNYYDVKGNLCLLPEGYSGWACKYDERGNQVEIRYLGIDGQNAKNKLISRSKYDKNDNQIEYFLFNSQGEPAVGADGYAGLKMFYDARNQETERQYFGVNGKLRKAGEGVAIVRYKYDDRGNNTEISWFDENKVPCLNSNRIAKQVSEFNVQGQVTRQAYYDEKGNPTPYSGSSPEVRAKYDQWGNITEISCYDGKGNLIIGQQGYAIQRSTYDFKGNTLETAYFNAENKPCENTYKYHKIVYIYDNQQQLEFQKYYKLDGTLMGTLDKNGELVRETTAKATPAAAASTSGTSSSQSGSSVNLRKVVDDYNNRCPIVVVDGLIIEKATLVSASSISYIWKVVETSKYELDRNSTAELQTKIDRIAKDSKYVKNLLSSRIKVEITVNDKAGRQLFKLFY